MSAAAPTVAAALTAPSPGAIAVVAIGGPNALPIVQNIIRQPRSDATPVPKLNRPQLIRIVDDTGNTLDDAMLVVPHRDAVDYVELQPHGGVRVVERVLELLATVGAAIVDQEQFAEAYLTDSPFERDLNAALLQSTSRRLTDWLLSQAKILPKFLGSWSTHDEASQAAYIKRTELAIRLIKGLRIALVGPPNAGKSTLANRLIGKDRIITSDTAGTTRDWVDESINIDGWPVTLIDTAGRHDTADALESTAIERGRAQAQTADLIIELFDATTLSAHDRLIVFENDRNTEEPAVLPAVNKIDRLSTAQLESLRRDIGSEVLFVSAINGAGLDSLSKAAVDRLKLGLLDAALPTGFCAAHLSPPEASL